MKLLFSQIIFAFCSVITSYASNLPEWIQQSRPVNAKPLAIPAYSKINESLQKKGIVKLIVRLAPSSNLSDGFAIEGHLKSSDVVVRQRAHIADIQNRVSTLLSKQRVDRVKKFDFIPFMALDATPTEFEALVASQDIDLIEEDIPVPPTLTQSVPLIGVVSGTFNGYTGNGQTVAILDTGVDKTHPFLAGKVVSEACYSTTYDPASATSVCTSGSTAAGAGVNCASGTTGCDHGTHVAGIVAGKGSTFSGVAKDATLIAIQVFSQFPIASCGTGATVPCVRSYTSDQISGLNRVYDLRNTYNISSVNMSLGGGSYTTNCDTDANYTAEKAAIDTLRSVGIATVIASGNDGYNGAISGPACISTAISVGATDKSNVVANYSNSASILNLLVPGSSIYSSIPGGSYGYKSGTSMATPHVSGAWAVLKSAKPTATVAEILSALTSSGMSITDARNSIVKPRIQLNAAVNAITNGPVNGVCGSSHSQVFFVAPATNLCLGGTASAVSGSGPWTWACNGSNGGTTVSCSTGTSIGSESFSTCALPTGWTVTDNAGTGAVWLFNNPNINLYASGANLTGGTGCFAVADSDWAGEVNMDTELRSSPYNLSAYSSVTLGFKTHYQYWDGDKTDVDVSNNGGTTWNTVWSLSGLTADSPTYTGTESVDISLLAAGKANVMIRFHYYNANWDYWWQIDDVVLTGVPLATVPLTFTFAGTGYGSVNSNQSGISCTGTKDSVCIPSSFNSGSTVTLTASADLSSSDHSTFTGWTPACNGTGPCSVTMNGPVNVTGTFNRDKLVKFITQGSGTYGTILDAVGAATTGQTIQVRDNSGLTPFEDALIINKSITLKGGFASGFGANTGYTTTNGKLTIANGGVLKVQRIIIR